jgi:hypothetical protein
MATANLIQTSVSGRTQNALAAQGDGLILPKVSSADRIALALTTSDAGLQVYDTTAGAIYIWNGVTWIGALVGYTQGIWTPSVSIGTGSVTLSPANSTGLWSRIGNTVTVVGHFVVQSVNLPTGNLSLTNLPYNPVSGFEGAVAVTGIGFSAGAITSIVGTISSSSMQLYHYQNGVLNPLAVHLIANTNLYVSATYITA